KMGPARCPNGGQSANICRNNLPPQALRRLFSKGKRKQRFVTTHCRTKKRARRSSSRGSHVWRKNSIAAPGPKRHCLDRIAPHADFLCVAAVDFATRGREARACTTIGP